MIRHEGARLGFRPGLVACLVPELRTGWHRDVIALPGESPLTPCGTLPIISTSQWLDQ